MCLCLHFTGNRYNPQEKNIPSRCSIIIDYDYCTRSEFVYNFNFNNKWKLKENKKLSKDILLDKYIFLPRNKRNKILKRFYTSLTKTIPLAFVSTSSEQW